MLAVLSAFPAAMSLPIPHIRVMFAILILQLRRIVNLKVKK